MCLHARPVCQANPQALQYENDKIKKPNSKETNGRSVITNQNWWPCVCVCVCRVFIQRRRQYEFTSTHSHNTHISASSETAGGHDSVPIDGGGSHQRHTYTRWRSDIMISLGCIHTVCFYDSQNEELQVRRRRSLVKAPGFKTMVKMSGCKFFICGKHNLM